MTQKHAKSQPISGEVRQAYAAWMRGDPFTVVKRRVGKPLMVAFARLSGVNTWKQAVAKRTRQLGKGN